MVSPKPCSLFVCEGLEVSCKRSESNGVSSLGICKGGRAVVTQSQHRHEQEACVCRSAYLQSGVYAVCSGRLHMH